MNRVPTRMFSIIAAWALCLGCGATAPPPTVGSDEDARTGPSAGWPDVMVVMAGEGPSLYLGPEGESPAIGYVTKGARVRIDGPEQNGRVPVTVGGRMISRGWMPLTRLGLYATQRGRVDGTPVYLAPGDLVSVLGRNADGTYRVGLGPWLGRSVGDRIGPYDGTLEAEWLSATAPDAERALNPGENRLLPEGRDTLVYDQPGGNVIARIPPASPPHTVVVLRSRGDWHGIRAGVGPFLIGYVEGTLAEADGPPRAQWSPPQRSDGEMPEVIAHEEGPLLRIQPGTEVRFLDRVIARVRSQGWARQVTVVGSDQLDVFVAVDDTCSVRGLVPTSAASAVEAAATARAQTRSF